MGLKDAITDDMKNALRQARQDPEQKIRLDTVRVLLAEMQNAEIEKHGELSDEEIVELVRRQIRRREEAIEQFRKGGRDDLVAKETKEAEVLGAYMPAQLTDEEIRVLVEQAISETGAGSPKETGRVMGAVMPRVKGRADGRRVGAIVGELLAGRE